MPPKSIDEKKSVAFNLEHHDELVSEPVLAHAEAVLANLRQTKGEIREVLTPKVQEAGIYDNPEIFALFEHIRMANLEPQELDLFLSQFTHAIELPHGTKIAMLGSGWGITGRSLAKLRPDLSIVHADINPDIVMMDRMTNNIQGFTQITSVVSDVTRQENLTKLLDTESLEVASVGLMRYLDTNQRRQMLTMLINTAPKGTKFLMREVNWQTMSALKSELDERGIGYQYESQTTPHLRYTRTFAYYYMYNAKEPMVSAIKEIDPNFDFEAFRQKIDELKKGYPQIDTKKIFGDEAGEADLRHLLVLADLAGHDLKQEEIIVFHN